MRWTVVSKESVAFAHRVSISVYCGQSWTSSMVPTRPKSSTATSSVSGAQSSGPSMVGTRRSIAAVYSSTRRVSGPTVASLMTHSPREDVREIGSGQQTRSGRADIRDRVDRAVGVEGGNDRREVLERHRERHREIHRRVAVDADAPPGRLQTPVRLHVARHEAVLDEPDPVDA